jgi:hypothetical protein
MEDAGAGYATYLAKLRAPATASPGLPRAAVDAFSARWRAWLAWRTLLGALRLRSIPLDLLLSHWRGARAGTRAGYSTSQAWPKLGGMTDPSRPRHGPRIARV